MILPGQPLPERTLQPPDPPPVCDDCNAYLDEDGDCAVCAEAEEYAAKRPEPRDADDANDARRDDRRWP